MSAQQQLFPAPVLHRSGEGPFNCEPKTSRGVRWRLSDTPTFISRARKIHGEIYDYSLVSYVDSQTKVTIVCPQHGIFLQKPNDHLNGIRCPHRGHRLERNREKFLKKVASLHNNKYNYSQVQYIDLRSKIAVTCPAHGLFEQQAGRHLAGQGCPVCAKEAAGCPWRRSRWVAMQANRVAKLYVVQLSNDSEVFYKAGITFLSVKQRFKPSTCPYSVKVLAVFGSLNAARIHALEASVKKTFKAIKYLPAREFAGCTECFSNAAPLISFLTNQAGIEQLQ